MKVYLLESKFTTRFNPCKIYSFFVVKTELWGYLLLDGDGGDDCLESYKSLNDLYKGCISFRIKDASKNAAEIKNKFNKTNNLTYIGEL